MSLRSLPCSCSRNRCRACNSNANLRSGAACRAEWVSEAERVVSSEWVECSHSLSLSLILLSLSLPLSLSPLPSRTLVPQRGSE